MTEFKVFLKEELDFTTGKHYTEIGMAYGLMFGAFIEVVYGMGMDSNLGSSVGLSIGTSMGMLIGILYGARKDTEAKKTRKSSLSFL